jgi:hypothetical protein
MDEKNLSALCKILYRGNWKNMKQLAIMKNVGIMYEDHSGESQLKFDSYTSEHGAALQLVSVTNPLFVDFWEAMDGNVKNLEGKPCWVELEGGFVRLKGYAKI